MDHDDHNLGTALMSIIGVGAMLFLLDGARSPSMPQPLD
jgi:hypothetical protein